MGGICYDAVRRADAVLARARIDLTQGAAAFESLNRFRPPTSDPPLDGNAWSHYGPAFEAIEAIPGYLADAIPEIEGTTDPAVSPPDEHLLENLFSEYAAQIEAIRDGTRSRLVNLGLKIEVGPGTVLPHLNGAIRASRFMTGALSHAHRLGREGEALELAGLGLAMAQDLSRGRLIIYSLVGSVCEGITVEGVRDVLANHSLTVKDLSRFASKLDLLDESRLDVMESWAGEDLYIRAALCNLPWEGFERGMSLTNKDPVRASWRCLFSQRITRAQALTLHAAIFEQLKSLATVPPWQREGESQALFQEAQKSKNPLITRILPALSRVFHEDALAQLKRVMLRVSVAVAWFESERGEYPQRLEDLVPRYLSRVPLCPFTGLPLRTRDGKVWSVGKNRLDDGGVVDPLDPEEGGTGDIVWTVNRR